MDTPFESDIVKSSTKRDKEWFGDGKGFDFQKLCNLSVKKVGEEE